MKKVLVCGAGGFIGSHLVKRLKGEGYWIRGVDLKRPEFSETEADEFRLLDLRRSGHCRTALAVDGGFDEVYQLAADFGGMGYIDTAEANIVHNNALINIHMTHAAARMGVPRYFFSSSVCTYRDMQVSESELTEDDAYPAQPDNEYGWEKLYAERVALTYACYYPMQVRIARFQNCYGISGEWRGGREKAPAALCRKVAEAKDGGEIEVWGDGTAVRSYTYIDDLVNGIRTLMDSDLEGPTNIGASTFYTVDELANAVIAASGKRISIRHIEGPVGVQYRNFSKARIHSLGWRPAVSLEAGIGITYKWIEEQVEKQVRET